MLLFRGYRKAKPGCNGLISEVKFGIDPKPNSYFEFLFRLNMIGPLQDEFENKFDLKHAVM